MSVLQVLHIPDERLRKVAKPVEEVNAEIQRIVDDMFETMYAEEGIGLAATQVDIHQRIIDHITIKDQYRRPYVFMHGIGSMYPYLRVNEFLALYEDYNESGKYKIIVFYPGHREQNSFRLFDTLPDNHTYRATLLINE